VKILIAKTAGFCMGVRRAVEIVFDTAHRQDTPVQTFGPLIHNPQVLKVFEEKGINTEYSVPESGTGSILIRAHGVPPDIKVSLVSAGFKVIDATCPRVIKVQTIIRKHACPERLCIHHRRRQGPSGGCWSVRLCRGPRIRSGQFPGAERVTRI